MSIYGLNIDVVVFGVYRVAVAVVGYFASRKEMGSEDYFLAGFFYRRANARGTLLVLCVIALFIRFF